jgi:hypothetical protein
MVHSHSAPARPPGPLSHIHRSILHSQCGAVLLLIDPRRCMGGQRIPCCRTAAEFYGPRAGSIRYAQPVGRLALCSLIVESRENVEMYESMMRQGPQGGSSRIQPQPQPQPQQQQASMRQAAIRCAGRAQSSQRPQRLDADSGTPPLLMIIRDVPVVAR